MANPIQYCKVKNNNNKIIIKGKYYVLIKSIDIDFNYIRKYILAKKESNSYCYKIQEKDHFDFFPQCSSLKQVVNPSC